MSFKSILNRLFSYFVQGLLFLAPVYITLYIIYIAFIKVDGIIPIEIHSEGDASYRLYGIGLLIVLFIIISVGFIGSTFLAVPVFNLLEAGLSRIPLVGIIYQSLKDLVEAFVGDKRKFNQPVIVLINKESGFRKLGFLTQTDLSFMDMKGFVTVYCPHSYAFSGEMFVVPVENVSLLHIPAADVMKFIVSGGVSFGTAESEKSNS
ncbi:Uncharacterized membrane protein [Pseudarcicella hirudinis]|uniref:Uncharacterized membrane protein n=1 Tax=Pseudarcicella hirudinis TaxID=1079859 RepID=A0A1I5SSP5_9BACT|nr:DUF502 domain-containing protein [Pseudarcicella hirudinis]SFP73708.1 Uncharacterized membrane protein [Pseudarcicella hirudinis]